MFSFLQEFTKESECIMKKNKLNEVRFLIQKFLIIEVIVKQTISQEKVSKNSKISFMRSYNHFNKPENQKRLNFIVNSLYKMLSYLNFDTNKIKKEYAKMSNECECYPYLTQRDIDEICKNEHYIVCA